MDEKQIIGKKGNGDSPIKQLFTHRVRRYSTVLSNGLRNDLGWKKGEQLILQINPLSSSSSSFRSLVSSLFSDSTIKSFQQQSIQQQKRIFINPTAFMKAQPFFANPPVTISVTNYGEAPLSIPTFLSLFPDGFSDYENDLKWKYLIIRFKKKGQEKWDNNNEDYNKNINTNQVNNEMDQNQQMLRKNAKMTEKQRQKRYDQLFQFLQQYKIIIKIDKEEEEQQEDQQELEEEEQEDQQELEEQGDEQDDEEEEDDEDIEIPLSVWSLEQDKKEIKKSANFINNIFTIILVFVMLICLFSLISSMNTNVLEQKKEIGIQRAIGITRFQLMRVYIEEAFILVFSAAVMGMLVGIIMGYILTSQATVMQGLPIPFIFPWQLILVSIAMAIIVAIIASAGPSWSVVSSNIVIVMRST